MPNTETVHLAMTPGEADRVAYVLMSSLRVVSMLGNERATITITANELFRQLGYSIRVDDNGNRVESKR